MNIIEKLTSTSALSAILIKYLEFLKIKEIKIKHLSDLIRAYAISDTMMTLKTKGDFHIAELFLEMSKHLNIEELKTNKEMLKKEFPDWVPMKEKTTNSKDTDDLLNKITTN